MSDLDTKIDDAELETELSPEQPKKSRGRKPKGEPKPKPAQSGKKEKLSARQLTGIIYLGNNAAAQALNSPIFQIEENEAEKIANALVDVLQYYDFEASAKTIAWANLAGTLATVYGLRVWSVLQNPTIRPIAEYSDDATGD